MPSFRPTASHKSHRLTDFIGAKFASARRKRRRLRERSRRLVNLESLEQRLLLATVSIPVGNDNTLYENGTGDISNGRGNHIFAGKTQTDGFIRRAVMAFNPLDAGIPAGSTITEATLGLSVSRAPANARPTAMTLHSLTQDWGEGTSRAAGQEGQGIASTRNDATWLHTFWDIREWDTLGGDFDPAISAAADVGPVGTTTTWSSDGLVADVQNWVDNPTTNFGWILIGDEESNGTARRFWSGDSLSGLNPKLDVTFEPQTLNIVLNDFLISENGGSTMAAVTRTKVGGDLTVQLFSDDTSEATLMNTVVIPDGQNASLPFPINAVDDNLLDGTQFVTITASAAGHVTGFQSLGVSDFEPLAVTIADSSISESGGSTLATVSRTDSSFPLTIDLAIDDTSEATAPASITLAVGETESAPFVIDAADDSILDGTQTVTILASASGFESAVGTLNVTDFEELTVSITGDSIQEAGGTTTAVVSRPDSAGFLLVTLASDDTGEATVRPGILIPDGQVQSLPFNIFGVDDGALDGTQIVTISATATGYQAGSDSLEVTDFGPLVVAIADGSISELGGSTTATVTRTDTTGALSVQLLSDDLGEATVAASVTIRNGQATSAPFAVNAVDDAGLDGTQTVTITAKADGHGTGFSTLDITDFEQLSVSIDADSISENGSTTTGTVTRTDTNGDLTVNLVVDDPTGATVAGSVIIVDGQAISPAFTIGAVDDAVVDGTQTVTISATATGYVAATDTLDITDFEELIISIDASTISENGGATTATVTRADTSGDLTVNLISEDPTEAVVVASVVIPDGQTTSSLIAIDAVDDLLFDGTQTVTISASAPGYVDASDTLGVTDFEELGILIADGAISENGGTTTGTVTRNDPLGDLVVLLMSDASDEAAVDASVTIPDGEIAADFSINGVDDSLLDGTQTVAIGASAAGYQPISVSLAVTDFEQLAITLATSAIGEDGGLTTATVIRPGLQGDLVLQLASSDPGEATVLESVTIPNGLSSRNFLVRAQDESDLDGDQTVVVTASASGYIDGTAEVRVIDDDTVTIAIEPSKDNTLYENQLGSRSNGAGDFLFSGRNRQASNGIRRVVLGFDLTNQGIPAGSTVTSANLSLSVSQSTSPNDEPTTIHRLTQDWGEGTSHAAGAEGGGGDSAPGDATWIHSFYDTQQWATPGGGFEAAASATVGVGAAGSLATWSSDALTSDVQNWLEAPSMNYGWILVGNEATATTAKRFASKDNPTGISPLLTLTYAAPSESLTLIPADASISENGGGTAVTISRTGSTANDLTVMLSSDDTSEATAPASVTITAGSTSATFGVVAVDDAILDGTQLTTIRATATGFVPGAGAIGVIDFEPLSIAIADDSISESRGMTTATVTRIATAGDLLVTLLSADSTEAVVVGSITISDGQATSDPFAVEAVNDSVLDGIQAVSIIASAAGYEPGSDSLEVIDDDTTGVSLDGDVLTISGSVRDDNLTLEIQGSNLVISDPFNALSTRGLGSTGAVLSQVSVPLASISGGVTIKTEGGTNTVRLDATIDNAVTDILSYVGGNDQDRLIVEGQGLSLDLSRFSDVDQVDIRGDGVNTLNLNPDSVLLNISNGLTVQASVDDTVNYGDGWRLNNTVNLDGVLYRVLVQGNAQFLLNGPSIWQNPIDAFDLDNDGFISATADVLPSINELNVPTIISDDGMLPLAPSALVLRPNGPFHDTDGDGVLSPSDILARINRLHQQAGAGEGEGEGVAFSFVAPVYSGAPSTVGELDRPSEPIPLWGHDADNQDGWHVIGTIDEEPVAHDHYAASVDHALAELDSVDLLDAIDELSDALD
jgi:hypothetical protein